MKLIRTKIFLGVLFLFSIIVALSLINLVFINQLAKSTKGTIFDNYRSVDYTTAMLASLDKMHVVLLESKLDSSEYKAFHKSKDQFDKYLYDEANNITEPGERELVSELSTYYNSFIAAAQLLLNSKGKKGPLIGLDDNYNSAKSSVVAIYSLNMSAILGKNATSEKEAHKVVMYTLIIGAFSIVLTLFFILTFPSRIVKPIKDLTNKIKAISLKDYNQKLEVNSNDEIGELARAFNSMAEKLMDYESQHLGEILTGKQRLEALVQNMQDGIIVLDNNNKVVLANQVIAELTGIKKVNLIDKNVSDIAVSNDLLRDLIAGLFRENRENFNEKKTIRIIRNKKEYFYEPEVIQIISNADNSGKSNNMGNMILLKNITWFEERDVAKTNLISTVSHEMKTPISSINLTIKLLEDSRIGNLNNEQKELIQAIRQQCNRLSKVVNEILDYSQIETGNIRLNFSVVHPEDIIDYATTAMMIILSEKDIQLETSIQNDLPTVNVDVEKTVWILINLITNAIRYSPKGGKIILSCGIEKSQVFFSVRDFGPGIAPENQAKLFSRFTQVGERSKRGWGIGLAISKEFVQAQGGTIKVESNENEGSKFTFYLPINLS